MPLMPETEAIITPYSVFVASCTAVIGKTVLFFGGNVQISQISQVTPLGLMRIGTLPFQFREGSCFVNGSQLILGLEDDDPLSCWSR